MLPGCKMVHFLPLDQQFMKFENDFPIITNIALLLSIVIETICAPTIIYLAAYHSRQMKRYRYLIINTAVWSLLLNWFILIFQPQFEFPAVCLLFRTSLLTSPNASVLAAAALTALYANAGVSVGWSFLYRYSMAYPGRISEAVERGKEGPIILATAVELEEAALYKELPDLFDQRHEFGYLCGTVASGTRRMMFIEVILILVVMATGLILYAILFNRVIIQKSRFNLASTQRMHRMLFKALSAEIFIAYTMLIFPTVAILYSLHAQWEEGTTICAVALMVVQLHGAVDFLAIIYFITPYRRKLLSFFKKNRQEGKISASWSQGLTRETPTVLRVP
ncbi:unnamed protein product [Bursaphelenchus xylophilus]|uniref:(pine wood nematode) hypothetical protein n=1 Tax=Bursaphelenchus xylophilus TaxID=6326 RepID=A0A1I7RUQ2_BURXY|nr:unnamed protein product [Bursaphelenchus xylophilus]CAG9114314.1 unnamed protein product [Bursaphelenchus xylophilus]